LIYKNTSFLITIKQIKLINSLKLKKNRFKHNLFVVEGEKNVQELLNSNYEIHSLFATNAWKNKNPNIDVLEVSDAELNRISNNKNPNKVLALAKIKVQPFNNDSNIKLVLDDVKDPGNLGTIIRICDWFNVRSIICSKTTADCYNSKVVQASMGSIFRVSIIYTDLLQYLKMIKSPIYCACLDGENIKKVNFPKNMHLVIGNESKGIKEDIINLKSNKVTIENFGSKTESLNVAIAASIFLHEIF